jgi:hypothetical protein
MDQLANAVAYPDLLGNRANAATTGGATSTKCTPENAHALKSTNGTLIPTQFATPQARDFRTGQQSRWENPERTRNLNDQIGGQLNPTWVEWLMGWPIGWTDLKQLGTGKFQQWLRSHGKSSHKINNEMNDEDEDEEEEEKTPPEGRWDYDHGPDHMREILEG